MSSRLRVKKIKREALLNRAKFTMSKMNIPANIIDQVISVAQVELPLKVSLKIATQIIPICIKKIGFPTILVPLISSKAIKCIEQAFQTAKTTTTAKPTEPSSTQG